jgi:transcriptional regulator with XRE-family HTH domain
MTKQDDIRDRNNRPTLIPIFPVGNRLRYARLCRGLTQEELARRVGLTQGTITNYERGYTQRVELEIRKRLSQKLRVSRRWLFDDNGRVRS